MLDFTIVVPYWNGRDDLLRLLSSLPENVEVIVVDDRSEEAVPNLYRSNTRAVRLAERSYFAGAVNAGIDLCSNDVLVLNQDAYFEGNAWLRLIEAERGKHAIFGEGVMGHPAWPKGYVQGTFMYIDREAWEAVGPLNAKRYPLWGCTCEWQLRACRLGYSAKPMKQIPDFVHAEHRRVRWGRAITKAIIQEPEKRGWFIQTPPLISVIVPCYNYANYLPQAVASLIGGKTDLGKWDRPGQTLQSFEIVIVDDASPDNTPEIGRRLADPMKGIRYVRLNRNRGTAGALNAGIAAAYGAYIHILSADDLRRPFTLSRLFRGCQNGSRTVSYGDIETFRSGKIIKHIKLKPYDFDRLLHKNMMPAGIMYPKRAWQEVGGYPTEMADGREDWAFNIALGVRGWCGHHVGESGNLVRREGTNRSVRTAQQYPNARQHYKRKIMAIFPDIYGGKRPVGCCGKGNTKGMPKHNPSAQRVGGDDPVLIEYVGGNVGTMTWDTPKKNRYRFGGRRKVGYVHAEDAGWFLGLIKNRRPLFKKISAETKASTQSKPKRPLEPEPEPTPEPQPEPEAESEPPREPQPLVLTDIKGVGATTAERMREGGYLTVQEVAEADPDEMAELTSIVAGMCIRHIKGARRVLGID